LPQEAELARSFGDAGKAVLGICLGAQLIARGFGAENVLGRPIEFGWRPVRPTEEGRLDPVVSALGEGAPVFHWHLDTFTLPAAR
jgi:GMP synthase-like glutamine amidotransferase